jgi:peptidoglycan/xylan/chitin deacetylase (PgdA/CDA1 family)
MSNGIEPDVVSLWPGGHRGAVTIVVAVEGPAPASENAVADTGVDYAATGLHRLLEMLDDFDISVTTTWTESALNSLPQLLRRVADQGHEVAASFAASDLVSVNSPLVGALRRVSGLQVTGAYSGAGSMHVLGNDDSGFDWQITGTGGDLPTITGGTAESGTTVQIPVSSYWNDRTWLHPDRPLPPSSLLETWSASLAEVRSDGSLMTIVIHPHIILRPGFAGTLVRFLDETIASGDVWLTRVDNLAQWWIQRNLGS